MRALMLRIYNPRPRIVSNWTVGVLSAHALAGLVLLALGMNNPKISIWLAEAAQTESVAPDLSPAHQTMIARPFDESPDHTHQLNMTAKSVTRYR
jgi:hypothetical protein